MDRNASRKDTVGYSHVSHQDTFGYFPVSDTRMGSDIYRFGYLMIRYVSLGKVSTLTEHKHHLVVFHAYIMCSICIYLIRVILYFS